MDSIINRIPKPVRTLTVLTFWVMVWQLVAVVIDESIILPSPLEVAKRLVELGSEKAFYETILNSVYNIISGFLTAVSIGVVLGIVTAKIRIADELLSPLLSIVKATPVASFIILALYWIDDKNSVPPFIAFLMVLPIIHGNVSEGLKSTPKELLEMAKVYRLSFTKRLTKLYLPSILPYFTAGIKISMGLAWKAGVAAEVIAYARNTIGFKILAGKNNLEMTDVFAWTVVLIAISVMLEKAVIILIGRLSARKERREVSAR